MAVTAPEWLRVRLRSDPRRTHGNAATCAAGIALAADESGRARVKEKNYIDA